MSENNENGRVANTAEAIGEGAQVPQLRPHVTIIRQLTYQGDAEHVQRQVELNSLPDGLYVAGTGTFTITVQTAPFEAIVPQWLGQAKEAQLKRLEAFKQEQADRAKVSQLISPHTGRPIGPRGIN